MDVFLARQPIFRPDEQVEAYELLYRPHGQASAAAVTDAVKATGAVIVSSFMDIGIQHITGGRTAFINFDRAGLLEDFAEILPPDVVVIEVLEDVPPDDEVIAACQKLKANGYRLALDDIVGVSKEHEPLYELADIIKVDFMDTDPEVQEQIPVTLADNGRLFLAEKVESREVFEFAVDSGYTLLQGYFFSRPEMVTGHALTGYKLNYLRLLQELHSPDVDLERLDNLIRSDVSLTYKLLRFINTAAFGWRQRIESVRHALVALGYNGIKKWVSLVCLTGMGADKPTELLVQAILRAHMCEIMARSRGWVEREANFFLTGLFSNLDAIVDLPLAEVLGEIPLHQEVVDALLHDQGDAATALQLVKLYERGQFDTVTALAERLSLLPQTVPESYFEALGHADSIYQWRSAEA